MSCVGREKGAHGMRKRISMILVVGGIQVFATSAWAVDKIDSELQELNGIEIQGACASSEGVTLLGVTSDTSKGSNGVADLRSDNPGAAPMIAQMHKLEADLNQ